MFNNVLFTNAETKDELFEIVFEKLFSEKYVNSDYLFALKEREQNYPTGLKIDFQDGTDIIYSAIPHTEPIYCLTNKVVCVINSKKITMKHMINPAEDCFVEVFFFIINNESTSQTKILSKLMEFFVTKGNIDNLKCLKTENEIEQFLIEKGVF